MQEGSYQPQSMGSVWRKRQMCIRDRVLADLQERLNYELSTIENMGYVEYFLIVWDFINYAKENHIMVGTGRGSAAGSIVAYTLRITDRDVYKRQDEYHGKRRQGSKTAYVPW